MQSFAILMVSLLVAMFLIKHLKAILTLIVVCLLALAIYGFLTLWIQVSGQ